MKEDIDFQCNVSPRNSRLARIARRLVDAAVRLHGTICISFLTDKEIEEALHDQAE